MCNKSICSLCFMVVVVNVVAMAILCVPDDK